MSITMRALRLAGLLLLLSAAACGDDDDHDHDHQTEETTKDAGPKVKDSGTASERSALPRPGLPRPPMGGLPDELRPPR